MCEFVLQNKWAQYIDLSKFVVCESIAMGL